MDSSIINQEKVEEAFKRLPHRYPFVLVDGVIDYNFEQGWIKAFKNVSRNEPFFQGHFPDNPIMPGVLIVEGMTQTAAILHYLNEDSKGDQVFFAGMDKVRFKSIVRPGDRIIFEVKKVNKIRSIIFAETKAIVDKKIAAKATLLINVSKES